MINIWNQGASLLLNGTNDATLSRDRWNSMVTNVAKNIRDHKDVYTWDGEYITSIVKPD